MKGTKLPSDKTIILMGHFDTVGIDDFNQLKDLACSPDQLMEALKKEDITSLVKQHLESGEWLFGRGTLDMKSGLASNLFLLKYFSESPQDFAGNLVFLAECDEEDSSHGILSALKTLKQWINAVIRNNPAWGSKHYVEFQDIRDINVPVINIGPYGYDAHKRFERMEMKYSLEIVPNLIQGIINKLL